MGLFTSVKHYAFSAITALAPANPSTSGGNLGKAVSAINNFVADLGVSESVKRQLVGIEQLINKGLVDLGQHHARVILKTMTGSAIEAQSDCSIYDASPTKDRIQRSGALVFVKYYSDPFGVVRDPIVEFVGFGSSMESAWTESRKLPSISAVGEGQFQKEKSYMLWYQFKQGEIVSGKIPYPFYLSAVRQ
jgi:hypothetical protein